MSEEQVIGLETSLDAMSAIAVEYGYPPVLSKACVDNYNYEAWLVGGEKVTFESAVPVSRDWVSLCKTSTTSDRGVDIQLSNVICFLDAPQGG